MKIQIRRMLAMLRDFLRRSRKRRTLEEFLPTRSNADLGRQELEKFIYW